MKTEEQIKFKLSVLKEIEKEEKYSLYARYKAEMLEWVLE